MELGRPPTYDSPELMQAEIDKYFESIKGERETVVNTEGQTEVIWKTQPQPITITGLCLYLGFESRQSFYDYEKKPDFSYTVKRARMMIENGYEQRLSGNNVAGSIFALKNLGWEDKTQRELSGGVEISKKPSWFDDVEQKTT